MYYAMLTIGALLLFIGLFWLIYILKYKKFTLWHCLKAFLSLLIGILMLMITLPSLKYMILKDYDVAKGSCTIEIDSSGRSSEAIFRMVDSDDVYTFWNIPDLDSYGRAVPYYCEITVTKDHLFEISYTIFDVHSRELIQSSK
ncbi:hypothetical protein [Rossellomorea sp. YZS02]|uniref:hypothetical protein n=1 Tax=Rossellomorea sp. YZS02 TaxID=3097358 RepID=UPI002A172BAD|nr:hypothetical protein [Rossellomorea sp. YZS02]MDX8342196.1 hypothetical protein [Rossellomorea sp. YZS02]